MPLPCLVCGRELESAVPPTFGNADQNQPYAGTTFWTSGHYGSTVFDPQTTGVQLHLNVCDPCLLERAGRIRWVFERRKTTLEYSPWEPVLDGGEESAGGLGLEPDPAPAGGPEHQTTPGQQNRTRTGRDSPVDAGLR